MKWYLSIYMANNWHDKTDEPEFGISDRYSLEDIELKHKYISPYNQQATPRVTKSAAERRKKGKRSSGDFWKKLNER